MTEVQRLNETPLSQGFKKLLWRPLAPGDSKLYLLQWVRQTVELMQGYWSTEADPEMLANLEALTFTEKYSEAYGVLLPPTEPLYSNSELMRQIKRVESAQTEEKIEEESVTLLEMLVDNSTFSDSELADLKPSLHEDR